MSRLLKIFLSLGFFAVIGCNDAQTALKPTGVQLTFLYAASPLPDQIALALLDASDEILAELQTPEEPRPLSESGQESLRVLLGPDRAGETLHVEAIAKQDGEAIAWGGATFEVTRGLVVGVDVRLSPEAGAAEDAGAGPFERDGGDDFEPDIEGDGGSEAPDAIDDGGFGETPGELPDGGVGETPGELPDGGEATVEPVTDGGVTADSDSGSVPIDVGDAGPPPVKAPDAGSDVLPVDDAGPSPCPEDCVSPFQCTWTAEQVGPLCNSCVAGYLFTDGDCVDVNECSGEVSNESPCRVDQVCTNTPGSFTCECPEGETDPGGTCAPHCGNTVTEPSFGEMCDDGNLETETCEYGQTSCKVCDASCQSVNGAVSYCGDGVPDDGYETCDEGSESNTGPYGGCNSDCTLASYCGDGVPDDAYEGCDEGAENNTGAYGGCSSDCTLASYCGDGVSDDGYESCDEGTDSNTGAYGGCSSDCTLASYCGDGVLDADFEACDEGTENNTGAYKGCNGDCTFASYCGDNVVDSEFEVCDGDFIQAITGCPARGFMPPEFEARLYCDPSCDAYNLSNCGSDITEAANADQLASQLSDVLNDERVPVVRLHPNTQGTAYEVGSRITLNRENGLLLEPFPGHEVHIKVTHDSDFMKINTGEMTDTITISNLTIRNARKGFDVRSSLGTQWVVLKGNHMYGRVDNDENEIDVDYLIRSSHHYTAVVQNRLETRSIFSFSSGPAINVSGLCNVVAYNAITGSFNIAINMKLFGAPPGCDSIPFIDHNTVVMQAPTETIAITLDGDSAALRNNLVLGAPETVAFKLAGVSGMAEERLSGNRVAEFTSSLCSSPGSCDPFVVCDNGSFCWGVTDCCDDYCDVNDPYSGCAQDGNCSIDEWGCPSPISNYHDQATSVSYNTRELGWFPEQSGSARDVGAREYDVAMTVGGNTQTCEGP